MPVVVLFAGYDSAFAYDSDDRRLSMKWSLHEVRRARWCPHLLVGALLCLVLPAQVSAQASSAGQTPGTMLDAGEYFSCSLTEGGGQNGLFEGGWLACWGENAYAQNAPPQGQFTAVSVGVDHGCALRASGQAVCWGNPGTIATPPPVGSYIALSAGSAGSCAVRSDGQLRCWGGVMAETAPTSGNFLTVDVSQGRGCAIRSDGTLQCWQAAGVASLGPVPAGRYLALSLGTSYACAIRSDGKVQCWGSNAQGQTNAPTAANFVAIASGHQHACGLQENGSIACWGANPSGQLGAPAGKFAAISAGRLHSCARDDEGSVRCWGGGNSRGELDTPTYNYQTMAVGPDQACGLVYEGNIGCVGATSVLTPPVRRYNALSFGSATACGLTSDGRAVCWGEQVGTAPEEPLRAIAVGETHVCGLRLDGSAVCWGDDSFGQASPVPGEYSSIVSGGRFSCGLGRDDGRARCWGQGPAVTDVPLNEYFYSISAYGANICGQAGTTRNFCWGEDAALLQPPAVPLQGIVVGARHACGVRLASANSIECWGDNALGQRESPAGTFYRLAAFGDTTCTADDHQMLCWGSQTLSKKSPGVRGAATAIAAGDAHTCTVRGNRGVRCWGDNAAGQRNVPIHFAQSVSANLDHNCTLRADGQLLCWGDNTHAGSTPVIGVMRAFDVGQLNGCAVAGSGALGCWGWNSNGQSTPPAGTFRSVATGLNHSCGIRDDATIACWGYNAEGQATAPAGAFRTVEVGERHSCAIAENGALQCWGLGTEGQTALPDLPGATYRALAVGAFHNCAIISNGGIVCWGRNDSGQATPPEDGLYTAVTAGFAHSCAVRADGARVCWGANTSGQAPQVSIGPIVLPQLTNGVAAAIDFTLGGNGGYLPPAPKFRIVSGALPYNLQFNEYGQVRGVPNYDPGIYPITIEAVDENGFLARRDVELVLNRAPDITPPLIRALVNGVETTAEWFNTAEVTLAWEVVDTETAVTSTAGCTASTLTTDTDRVAFTCSATSEGGTSTRTVLIGRDTTPPGTIFTQTPPTILYDNNYYTRVDFAFAATDTGISGGDGFQCSHTGVEDTFFDCPSPITLEYIREDAPYRFHVRARDRAGNVDATPAFHEWLIRRDTTPPVVTPSVLGSLGDNNWYRSDVQVSWTISDPETAITYINPDCADRSFTVDTAGYNLFCNAFSAAGEGYAGLYIKRDTVAPAIVASTTAAANAAGWHRQNVPVSYACVEVTSGYATGCPAADAITQEGRDVSSTAKTVRDMAGNVGTSNRLTVNLDKTPPVTSSVPTTQPNAAGWYRTNVVVDFTCSDALSGLFAPCTPQMIVTDEGGTNPGEVVYDVAGNSAFTGGTTLFIDKTPPTILASASGSPNASGWYNGNVAVVFSCSDARSGIIGGTCPTSQLLSQEGAAVSSVAQTVADIAGNLSPPSNVVTVKIDRTAPVLSVTMPPSLLFLNATHNFNLDATDALSGIASQSCGAMNTGTLGTRSVTCTATDRAGNSASRTATYRVIYDVVPLSAPLNNPGQLYLVEAPRSVPFEWRVRDANGVAITNASLTQTAVTDVVCPDTGIPLPTPPAGETNTFENFGDGRYRRNWWINPTNPISCLRLDVVLNDGITRSATVRIVPKIRRTGGPGQPVPQATSISRPMPASQRVPRAPQTIRRGVKPAKPSAR